MESFLISNLLDRPLHILSQNFTKCCMVKELVLVIITLLSPLIPVVSRQSYEFSQSSTFRRNKLHVNSIDSRLPQIRSYSHRHIQRCSEVYINVHLYFNRLNLYIDVHKHMRTCVSEHGWF